MSAAQALPFEDRLVAVAEYLRTSYQPDCDYVEGRVEERNVGEYEHATVQKRLMRIFLENEAAWGVNVIQECRLLVAERRFRVPDTMVLRADQVVERIVREVPLVCIEVMSPEDTWRRLSGVLGDYEAMGVSNIWAFDPVDRRAYNYIQGGLQRVTEAELGDERTAVHVSLAQVFGPA